jgi:hypothetical protein
VRRPADGNLAAAALTAVALFSNTAFDSEITQLLGVAFFEAAWEK